MLSLKEAMDICTNKTSCADVLLYREAWQMLIDNDVVKWNMSCNFTPTAQDLVDNGECIKKNEKIQI